MSPFVAEWIGTMLLLLIGGGVVANASLVATKGHGVGWLAITTAWALIDHPLVNFLTEAIGTFVLMFVVFYITDGELTYDSNSTLPIGLGSVGAIPVAFTVWAIGLSLGGPTGYAINPARDLVPRILYTVLPIRHKGSSQWSYAWIPVLAPVTGSIVAAFSISA